MVSTSGARLLAEEAVRTLCDELLPVTDILTPNIPEACLILKEMGHDANEIGSLDDLKELAKAVAKLGPKNVLLKGGHCPLTSDYKVAKSDADKHLVVNVLYTPDGCTAFEFPYQKSSNTHGTGCSLACVSSPWRPLY